jgi:diguanylate cyclase (GGDEF)-like protein
LCILVNTRMDYLVRTLRKLKEEILGKALYDLLRYGTLALVGLVTSAFFFGWLNHAVVLPLWALLSLLLLAVLATSALWAKVMASRLRPLVASSRTDALTQLLNSNALQEDLPVAIEKARANNEPLSLILFDIDNFKLFNTNYSSVVADQVLTKLGELLLSDKRGTDSIYRQHTRGDEFIFITRKTSLLQARVAAERKHKDIAETGLDIPGHREPLHLTVCCAIVELKASDTKTTLLERASIVMNRAKAHPEKNKIESLL